MATHIEAAYDFLDDLNPLWPLGSDSKSSADDHLRGIKKTLLATFPSLTGAVNVTQAQLNALGAAGTWPDITVGPVVTATDTGATTGPSYESYWDSASPAAADKAVIHRWSFKDSGANKTTGIDLIGQIISPTDGAEYASLSVWALSNNVFQKEIEIGDGVEVGSPPGGNLGKGSLNAQSLYNNGIPVGALATLTASGGATLDSPTLVPGIYEIFFNNIRPASSGASIALRFSVSGSFLSANYNTQVDASSGAAISGSGTTTLANGTSVPMFSGLDNTVGANFTGRATLIIGGATVGGTSVEGAGSGFTPAGAFYKVAFVGRNSSGSQIDGLRLLDTGGGNLTSGSMTIFRRA